MEDRKNESLHYIFINTNRFSYILGGFIMNKQKFQSMKTDRIDEIYRKYLSDDKVRNNLMKDILRLNENGCPLATPFDSPDTMIVCGVLMTYIGINSWLLSMSEQAGSSSISETLTKRR